MARHHALTAQDELNLLIAIAKEGKRNDQGKGGLALPGVARLAY